VVNVKFPDGSFRLDFMRLSEPAFLEMQEYETQPSAIVEQILCENSMKFSSCSKDAVRFGAKIEAWCSLSDFGYLYTFQES